MIGRRDNEFPNPEVVVLPDIGHEPFIEAQDETLAVLRDFLSQA